LKNLNNEVYPETKKKKKLEKSSKLRMKATLCEVPNHVIQNWFQKFLDDGNFNSAPCQRKLEILVLIGNSTKES